MKIRSITVRVPAPRVETTPAEALRQRLTANASTADLRRRLAQR